MSRNSNASNSTQAPPIIVSGPSFTIYGEIHNDIDNRFYERLYTSFTQNDRVLLEKTTDPQILQLEQRALQVIPDVSAYLHTIGGSEWLYTKGLIDGKSFEPIDIRIECGYPSQIQLRSLEEFAKIHPVDFIAFFFKTLKMVIHHKDRLNRPGIKERFNTFPPILRTQIQTYMKYLEDGAIDMESVFKIKTNLQLLGVLLVDAHLIDLITENNKKQNKKHLHIFVGARHANNLYECLQIENLEIHKTAKGELIQPLKPLE